MVNIDSQHSLKEDEEMSLNGDDTAMHSQHKSHHEQHEPNMRLRVTESRANELNHAKCILRLLYTKFNW